MTSFVLHHVGLSCNDPLVVERWYTKHFGFRRRRVYAPGPEQVVMIEAGGVYLELFHSTVERPAPKVEGAGPDYSGFRHFAFRVDDLDATLAQLGNEARTTLGPVDMSEFIPGMRVAWVADPEGNIVELNQGYVDEENPAPWRPEEADRGSYQIMQRRKGSAGRPTRRSLGTPKGDGDGGLTPCHCPEDV